MSVLLRKLDGPSFEGDMSSFVFVSWKTGVPPLQEMICIGVLQWLSVRFGYRDSLRGAPLPLIQCRGSGILKQESGLREVGSQEGQNRP